MIRHLYITGILLLCYFKSSAQIKGEYTGLFNQTYHSDTIDGALTLIPNWDGQKKIVFNKDNSYFFEYREKGWPCAARSTVRNCTGKYRIAGDTVYLTSTYDQEDFYTVTEKKANNVANGKIMIVTSYPGNKLSPETFINGFDLKVNDKDIGTFKIKDTIYLDAMDIKDIFLSCCSPYIMDWRYSPKDKASNYYHFVLKREINTEDISMNNYKMVKNEDKLISIDGGYLEVKDNEFKKK